MLTGKGVPAPHAIKIWFFIAKKKAKFLTHFPAASRNSFRKFVFCSGLNLCNCWQQIVLSPAWMLIWCKAIHFIFNFSGPDWDKGTGDCGVVNQQNYDTLGYSRYTTIFRRIDTSFNIKTHKKPLFLHKIWRLAQRLQWSQNLVGEAMQLEQWNNDCLMF